MRHLSVSSLAGSILAAAFFAACSGGGGAPETVRAAETRTGQAGPAGRAPDGAEPGDARADADVQADADVPADAGGGAEGGGQAPAEAHADAAIEADGGADASAAAHPDAGADAASAVDAAPFDGGPPPPCTDAAHPRHLYCTGLYSSWTSRELAADVRAFEPGVHLWSDGAQKRRFILLPPGTTIDTSDMDEWRFPVGTKIWKEFRLNGAAIETRFSWKTSPTEWLRTVYVWSNDELSAPEVEAGVRNARGTGYDVPAVWDCRDCHRGSIDGVLGFEAIGLSLPSASGLTMAALINEGRLSAPPPAPLAIPGNATESAALGWLHANCGTSCHNPSPDAFARPTGMHLRLRAGELGSVQATAAWRTAVDVDSTFQPSSGAHWKRLAKGDPDHSTVVYRDSYRDTQGERIQMPPLGTHAVDTQGVALVRAFVGAM